METLSLRSGKVEADADHEVFFAIKTNGVHACMIIDVDRFADKDSILNDALGFEMGLMLGDKSD